MYCNLCTFLGAKVASKDLMSINVMDGISHPPICKLQRPTWVGQVKVGWGRWWKTFLSGKWENWRLSSVGIFREALLRTPQEESGGEMLLYLSITRENRKLVKITSHWYLLFDNFCQLCTQSFDQLPLWPKLNCLIHKLIHVLDVFEESFQRIFFLWSLFSTPCI